MKKNGLRMGDPPSTSDTSDDEASGDSEMRPVLLSRPPHGSLVASEHEGIEYTSPSASPVESPGIILDVESGQYLDASAESVGDALESDDEPALVPERAPHPAPNQLYPKEWLAFFHFYKQHLRQRSEHHPHYNSVDSQRAIHGVFYRAERMPKITIHGKRRVCAGVFMAYDSVIADSMPSRDPKMSTLRQVLAASVTWAYDRSTRFVRRYPWAVGLSNTAVIVTFLAALLAWEPWLPGVRGRVQILANHTFDEQGKEIVDAQTEFGTTLANYFIQFATVLSTVGWFFLSSLIIYNWQKRPSMEHGRPHMIPDSRSPDEASQRFAQRTIQLDDFFLPYVLKEPSHEYFIYMCIADLAKQYEVDPAEEFERTVEHIPQQAVTYVDIPMRALIQEYNEDDPLMEPMNVLRRFLWTNVNFAKQTAEESAIAMASSLSEFIAAIEQLPVESHTRADAIKNVYGFFTQSSQPVGQAAMALIQAQLAQFARRDHEDDSVHLLEAAKGVATALAEILQVVQDNGIVEIPEKKAEEVAANESMLEQLGAAGNNVFAALNRLVGAAEQVRERPAGPSPGFFPAALESEPSSSDDDTDSPLPPTEYDSLLVAGAARPPGR